MRSRADLVMIRKLIWFWLETGKNRDQLEAQARDLGIRNQVRFLGLRTDIPEVLGAMDVFVLSSDFEGNPLSVMEAMASGLPIVSTAVGGIPDLVEDRKERRARARGRCHGPRELHDPSVERKGKPARVWTGCSAPSARAI